MLRLNYYWCFIDETPIVIDTGKAIITNVHPRWMDRIIAQLVFTEHGDPIQFQSLYWYEDLYHQRSNKSFLPQLLGLQGMSAQLLC